MHQDSNTEATQAKATDVPFLPEQLRTRQPVLVVLHSDQFVEVFAHSFIDVRIVDMPKVSSTDAEILAEEFIERSIPRFYRQVFWPGCRRAMHQTRSLTVDDIAYTKWKSELLREIQRIEASAETSTWIF